MFRRIGRRPLLGGVSPGLAAFADLLGGDPEGFLAPVQWHPDLRPAIELGPAQVELDDAIAAQAYAAALTATHCLEVEPSDPLARARSLAATTFFGRFELDRATGITRSRAGGRASGGTGSRSCFSPMPHESEAVTLPLTGRLLTMEAATSALTRRDLLIGAFLGTAALAAGRSPAAAGARMSAARWRRLAVPAPPPARSDHGLAFDPAGRVVYLYGGRRDGRPLGDLWALELATGAWRRLVPEGALPPARFTPIVLFDERRRRLVVALGQGDGNTFFADTWAFDPSPSSWRELGRGPGPRPTPRYGAGGAYDRAGDRLLVTHGFTTGGRFDDTWELELGSEAWRRIQTRRPLPAPRCLLHAAWDAGGGRLLLFGGQSDQTPYLGDLWALDPRSGNWRELRDRRRPTPRNLYAGAVDTRTRRWLLFGGATATGRSGDLWVYRGASGFWSRIVLLGPRPSPRQGAEIVIAGDRVVLFGGHDGRRELADTWTLPLLTIA